MISCQSQKSVTFIYKIFLHMEIDAWKSRFYYWRRIYCILTSHILRGNSHTWKFQILVCWSNGLNMSLRMEVIICYP
jgi:hypothetical protein